MKILLISGHGAGDPGAMGNGFNEADLTVEMVNGIAPLLKQYATVDIYPTERNAYKDIQKGVFRNYTNPGSYDYMLEIHFNAGGGTGTEVWVTSKEKGHSVEDRIAANVAALGLKNRGVKTKDFLVIKTVKNAGTSSALLETCFIDSAADMGVWKAKKAQFFEAVANGVAEGFGLKKSASKPADPKPAEQKPAPQPAKKSITEIAKEVLAGHWGNGEERKKKLAAAGYDYNAVQAEVNRLAGASNQPKKKSIGEIADEVIRGKWGNGADRKARLKAAGYDYAAVQKEVNKRL